VAAERPELQGVSDGGGAGKIADVHGHHLSASSVAHPTQSICPTLHNRSPKATMRDALVFLDLNTTKQSLHLMKNVSKGNSQNYGINIASGSKLI
jgi:hypothetical protein